MESFLFSLSSSLFFVLGTLFFIALAFFHGGGGGLAEWWLHVGDVPLLLSGLLYGACGLSHSLRKSAAPSWSFFSITLLLPLLMFFLFAILNFWPS